MVLFVMGILLLAVGIVAGVIVRHSGRGGIGALVIAGGIVLCLLTVVPSCFCSIPTGHTGVITTFGRVEDFTLDAGVHPKLPWQNVVKMDNRVQKSTTDLACFSSDIQEVTMTYTVNYQISKQDAMTIYKTIGDSYYDTVIAPCVTESVKIVTAKFTAEQLVSSRSNMAQDIEDVLSKRLLDYNIILVGTAIENMDFTDAFTDAVEAKQVAEQNKLRAQTEADQRVIEANANAEVKRKEAEAEAYETLTKAEAEAEANQKISASLTDELVAYTYAKAWNGELPTFMSDGSTIPMFDFGKIGRETTQTPATGTTP